MPETFGSIDKFREAAQASGEPLAEAQVRQSFDTEIKALDDSRSLSFTISAGNIDRMGDSIAVDGWKLDNYKKNPVVLWGHDASSLPVGKASKIWIEGGKLKSQVEFTPPGMARFNDTVFDMLKAGFLNATSVGFQPIKYMFSEDPARKYGIDFVEQELLEFSIVSIPANPAALIDAKSFGIDIEPMIDHWADQIVKAAEGERLNDILALLAEKAGVAVMSKERVERIERAATAQRIEEAKRRRIRDLELAHLKSF